VAAGSSGDRGRVTFQLPSAEPAGFVRLYVGKQTRSYDTKFDLSGVMSMNAVSSALEPRLARLLAQPGVYFVALTFVDRKGRESGFSNEIRVDTRDAADMASVERWRHAFADELRLRLDRRA
jgi:hypothetical protein